MEVNVFLREMYRIGKRWDEICVFEQAHSLNNTEMQMMREVVAAEETGGESFPVSWRKSWGSRVPRYRRWCINWRRETMCGAYRTSVTKRSPI